MQDSLMEAFIVIVAIFAAGGSLYFLISLYKNFFESRRTIKPFKYLIRLLKRIYSHKHNWILISAAEAAALIINIFRISRTGGITINTAATLLGSVIAVFIAGTALCCLLAALTDSVNIASRPLIATMEYTLTLLIICFITLIFNKYHQPLFKICIWTALMANYALNLSNMLLTVSAARNNSSAAGLLWKGCILIIAIFVCQLTLMQYAASMFVKNAFSQTVTLFDAFYLTVITFATVGYGDIAPTVGLSRGISVLTAVTSVICLILFVNSMMSILPSTKDISEKDKQ